MPRFGPRLALLLVFALAAWSGAVLRGGLALDDRELLEAPWIQGELPWTEIPGDYWSHRGEAGHWRPLALASARAEHALHGSRPVLAHATNVLLHLGVVLLAALATRRLPGSVPWLGLSFFALHPALADAVAWLSGRSSMLCALGGLAGLCLVARELARALPRGLPLALGAALAVVLALAGKEEGVLFAALLPLLALSRGRRAFTWTVAGALAGLVLAGALRAAALGSPFPYAPHAPLAGEPLVERLAAGGAALVEGLRLVALPLPHPPVLRVESLPLDAFARAARGLGGLAFALVLAGAGALALCRSTGASARIAGGSALLVAAAALPYLQLVPAGELFAPRFLYLPLLVGAPLVERVLRTALPTRGRSATLALGAVALVALCQVQSGVYASRSAWCEAVLASAPDDARAWNDLGIGLEEEGRPEEAERAWRRALALDPSYGRPWSNLGRVLAARGEREQALAALERAAALGPANPLAWHNLGALRLSGGEPAAAAQALERATRLAPGHAPSWRALARARLAAGDAAAARAALARALALDPSDAAARELARELELASPR